MADITITSRGAREYDVRVREPDGETSHRVTVPSELIEELGLPEDDLERVVHESFEFLLEREPASSILPEFALSDIKKYFDDYYDELARRVGAS